MDVGAGMSGTTINPTGGSVTLVSGASMPAVGFGTAHVTRAGVARALLAGVRHLDCARMYGNEATAVGPAIAASGVDRAELFLTSKLYMDEHSDAEASLRQVLSDLGVAYLDLFLIHWPMGFRRGTALVGGGTSLAATWAQMERLVDAGLVRDIGVSNFSAAQLEALMAKARIKPAVNQVELHLHFQQRTLVDFCLARGVRPVAWGPLNKSRQALTDDAALWKVAEARGCSVQKVALAFNLTRGVVVIPKSSRSENIASNLEASSLVLTADELRLLGRCDKGKRRFPDIIGIWETANPAAKAFGLLLRVICTAVFAIPFVRLDVCAMAKEQALLNEARERRDTAAAERARRAK